MDPSGSTVGLSVGRFAGTPFRNFLVPGLLLLFAFGLLPAAAGCAVSAGLRWGRPATVAVALALTGWVVVEVVVGFDRPTVSVNLATAALLLALSAFARRPGNRTELAE